ncbi:unnamed protein product [Knipowitschia caucasica]|uniref:Uncharacterized protein n=1 Tax=Knipowitschia caucasica TaxID=637954 RepID=A0AAV2K868_KNICA
MSRGKRPELPPKPGGPRREDMPTIPVKNTLLHLNGQNLALAAKKSDHSRAPGPHLSPVPVKEAAGRLTASPPLTQEATVQLDLALPKSHKLVLDTGVGNHQARRPLKLAPLVLSDNVGQVHKQKVKCNQGKTCVSREKVSIVELKKPSKAPIKSMQDVICQGTPAPLFPKLTPHSPHVKARGKIRSTGPNLTNQDNAEKRRLRLTREQCLEEAETKSSTSIMVALCSDEDKRAKGVRSRGQRQDAPLRGNPQSGKGIRRLPEVPQESRSVKKSSAEDRKSRELSGDEPSEPDGEKTSAASWSLKRRTALMEKQSRTVTLERPQL